MKKFLIIPAACLILAGGCASTAQMRRLEENSRTNQKTLHETDQRLQKLEQSVAALDSQVAVLNNRVYEVRTRSGRNTGMTVVPILPAQTAKPEVNSPQPVGRTVPNDLPASQNVPTQAMQMDHVARNGRNPQPVPISTPHGGTSSESARLINPAAPPASLPGKAAGPSDAAGKADAYSRKSGTAGPSGQVGKPDTIAGPSGQLAATGSEPGSLALPPAEMPAVPAIQRGAALVSGSKGGKAVSTPSAAGALGAPGGASSGASGNTAVQVPALPPSDLALPPEHPSLPPMGAPSANASVPPVSRENVATQQPASLKTVTVPKAGKGEEGAYKAALQAALSGRSAEGIARFREFLQQYPQGRYAANAEYWIGECLYAQGKVQEALAQFQKVNAEYPRHHKNADALLKAGICLSRLGDKAGAAQKYKTLLADFPNSEAARLARARGLAR